MIACETDMPKRTLLSGALYLGYYLALGAYYSYINLNFERLGFTGIQIGTLSAIPVLISSSTVMIWGGLADRHRWHHRILRTNLLLCALSVLLLSTAGSFQAIIPFIAGFALFNSPLVPLLDNTALEAIEGSKNPYGQVRVWGSIGWSISTVLVGLIIQRFAIQWMFYIYAALMVLTFCISLLLPRRQVKLKTSLTAGLKKLVLHLPFILFLLSIFLIAVTLSASNAFFSIYLDGIGASESIIGLAWAVSSLSEIPIMLFSAAIIRKTGASGLLKIALLAFCLRWYLLSLIRIPHLALVVQVLHGITFGGFLIGSVTYINDQATQGVRPSALAMSNLVTFGIGAFIGSLLGGFEYEWGGAAWLFRILGLIAAAGLGVFLLSQRQPAFRIQSGG